MNWTAAELPPSRKLQFQIQHHRIGFAFNIDGELVEPSGEVLSESLEIDGRGSDVLALAYFFHVTEIKGQRFDLYVVDLGNFRR